MNIRAFFTLLFCVAMGVSAHSAPSAAEGKSLTVVVPFAGADRETAVWAQQEDSIDFRRETEKAARCTSAFAALELQHYLTETLRGSSVSFAAERPPSGFFIELHIAEPASRIEKFSFARSGNGLVISAHNRISLLYGVYELLRLQGWRWYAPGKAGEIAPLPFDELRLPPEGQSFAPSFALGRGIDFSGISKESAELTLRMVRNRLDAGGYRPNTGALARKLGLSMVAGGHIFETILNPDRVLPSGKTLWEAHEPWYGLPADGTRAKSRALRTEFCMSQP